MKKLISNFMLLTAIAAAFAGCAKSAKTGPNEASIRYFDAWKHVNYPNAETTPLGSVIIERTDGDASGTEVTNDGFAYVNYITSSLDGTIGSYTDENTARKLCTYVEGNYYGPKIMEITDGYIQRGVSELLIGMHTGGHVRAAIPGWLMTSELFDTKEEYESTSTDSDNFIYEFDIVDFTTDVIQWQIDSMGRYMSHHPEIFADMTVKDTVEGYKGMYYRRLADPVDTTAFPSDTTIYINYTGRLLNGQVFDTTVEKVAKDNGIYSSTKGYSPVKVKWAEEATSIELSGSSVITGFALTLWQMRPMEKGIGMFTSALGYGVSGSGSKIPTYSPLIFEIEIVEEPED